MVAAIWSPKNGGSDEQNGSKTHSVQSYGFPKTRGAIEYRGSDSAPPKSGEVRVRIICSSLYYNDVTYWKMKDPHAYFPRILGHESFGWKVTHHLVSERFHQSANNRHENAPRPTHRLSRAF